MKLSARSLMLDLLLAASPADQGLSVSELVAACVLFGLTDNSARVSLVRLAAEDRVEAVGRGRYRLGAQSAELAQDLSTWRGVESRLRPWAGDFVMVLSASLGRSDRQALRRRERALDLLGFKAWEKGVSVRPHNLEDSVDVVRRRLYALGLERQASVMVVSQLDDASVASIRQLWDARALNSVYRLQRAKLDDWLASSHALTPDVATRQVYELGGQAIRQVIFDPLLPEPLVDVVARARFMETVRRFDEAGRLIWRQFFERHRALTPAVSETR